MALRVAGSLLLLFVMVRTMRAFPLACCRPLVICAASTVERRNCPSDTHVNLYMFAGNLGSVCSI